MLIGELTEQTGVSIHTIRFYEKQGLLTEAHFTRRTNGYRSYNEAAVARLTLIKQAQAAGITLGEMRASIDEWETGSIGHTEKVEFFRQKLEQIDERIAALQAVKAYISHKLAESERQVTAMP